jgi:SMC interacting uncharacterized protein involved in chromosome segregation
MEKKIDIIKYKLDSLFRDTKKLIKILNSESRLSTKNKKLLQDFIYELISEIHVLEYDKNKLKLEIDSLYSEFKKRGASPDEINKMKKRYEKMTGGKISKEKLDVLKKILKKRDELIKKHGPGFESSLDKAIRSTYKFLTRPEKQLLLLSKDEIKNDNNVPPLLSDKQVHSINALIYHHKPKLTKKVTNLASL